MSPLTQGVDSLALASGANTLLAWNVIDVLNKRGYGRNFVPATSDFPASLTVTPTRAPTGLACVVPSTTAGRLIKVRSHLPAANPISATNEWYFDLMVRINGVGDWVAHQQFRYAPTGSAAPSPEPHMIFITPAGTSSFEVRLDVSVFTATATLWRYDATSQFRSHMTVEDMGGAFPDTSAMTA